MAREKGSNFSLEREFSKGRGPYRVHRSSDRRGVRSSGWQATTTINKTPKVIAKSGQGARESFALFMDGLSDHTYYNHIRDIFHNYNTVVSIFVQKRKKRFRATKFGFVRFSSKTEA